MSDKSQMRWRVHPAKDVLTILYASDSFQPSYDEWRRRTSLFEEVSLTDTLTCTLISTY